MDEVSGPLGRPEGNGPREKCRMGRGETPGLGVYPSPVGQGDGNDWERRKRSGPLAI